MVGVEARCEFQVVSPVSGKYRVNFCMTISLVTCPCAFRLRRLTQNRCCSEASGIFLANFVKNMVLVTCPCELQARTNQVSWSGCPAFFLGVLQTLALVTCPCACRLRRLAPNKKPHTEILPRGLLQGACTEILPRDFVWRSHSEIAKRPFTEILPTELF